MKRQLFAVCLACAAMLMFAGGSTNVSAKDLSGQLEIFSWWAGDEGPALQALIDLYTKENPNVEVVNATVTGGSGVNAKAVLKTRMLGGEPPDSFQVHAGQELIGTWVEADRMEDLSFLFEEQGLMDVFPDGLVKLIGTDKGIWSMPVNIHRSNVVWYVPGNLKKWGVKAPATWDEFFAIAPKLKEQGVVPLALAQNWTANHLWESVALAAMGADNWDALWSGKLAFDSPEGVSAWELFGKVLEYTNEDASSLSWQQATDMVVDGRAAFNIMGDWAASFGTGGHFMFLADSFGLPKGAPNRDNVLAWLALLGSKEGSDAFNPLKGSISARTDSDLSKYNDYAKSASADFGKDRIVGSLAHGVTANEGFMNDFASVMEMFLKSRNAAAAANAAQQIAVKNGISM